MILTDCAAVQHLETYWSLLQGIRGSKLKLTRIDDEIHEQFKKEFPDFDVNATINEDDMKNKEGKERWRNFVNAYDKRIEDFNVGAIVRTSPKTEYTQDESIFGKLSLLAGNLRTCRFPWMLT